MEVLGEKSRQRRIFFCLFFLLTPHKQCRSFTALEEFIKYCNVALAAHSSLCVQYNFLSHTSHSSMDNRIQGESFLLVSLRSRLRNHFLLWVFKTLTSLSVMSLCVSAQAQLLKIRVLFSTPLFYVLFSHAEFQMDYGAQGAEQWGIITGNLVQLGKPCFSSNISVTGNLRALHLVLPGECFQQRCSSAMLKCCLKSKALSYPPRHQDQEEKCAVFT